MIRRRSLLLGILGAAAAPAIVRASSLMPVVPRRVGLITGEIGIVEHFRFVTSSMLPPMTPLEVFRRLAVQRPMPRPSTDTLRFRRPVPFHFIERDLSLELRQPLSNIRKHP